ncbi:hypothetical protein BC629DRAFT_797684 [Irpex lacteus]|nr:hypothetical protein BC629DRAFT_797684 [Irpex lacteus]
MPLAGSQFVAEQRLRGSFAHAGRTRAIVGSVRVHCAHRSFVAERLAWLVHPLERRLRYSCNGVKVHSARLTGDTTTGPRTHFLPLDIDDKTAANEYLSMPLVGRRYVAERLTEPTCQQTVWYILGSACGRTSLLYALRASDCIRRRGTRNSERNGKSLKLVPFA